jgi:hypothetical protein
MCEKCGLNGLNGAKRGDRVLTTPQVIGRSLCPNAGRGRQSKGNEGDDRREQKLHG